MNVQCGWNMLITHLLSLQFLLFPPLPLLIIHFTDLDVSLLLHTYKTHINIPQKKTKGKGRGEKIGLNQTWSYLFCFHGFHMKPFGKPEREREKSVNVWGNTTTIIKAKCLGTLTSSLVSGISAFSETWYGNINISVNKKQILSI